MQIEGHSSKTIFIYVIFNLFLASLSLRWCTGFSVVVARVGYSLVVVHSFLIAVASLVAEQGL